MMLGDEERGVDRGLSTTDGWPIWDGKEMGGVMEMKGEYEEKGRGRDENFDMRLSIARRR